jgi:tetratricopeptide (TPR) repeat protein
LRRPINNRCWLLYELGRYGEALPDCEKAVSLDPNEVYALDSRSFVHKALGHTEEAIADFECTLTLTDDREFVSRAEEALEELRNR